MGRGNRRPCTGHFQVRTVRDGPRLANLVAAGLRARCPLACTESAGPVNSCRDFCWVLRIGPVAVRYGSGGPEAESERVHDGARGDET